MQLSANFRGFFCLSILASISIPTSENPGKGTEGARHLIRSRSQVFEHAAEEGKNLDYRRLSHNSSVFLNFTSGAPRSPSYVSRGLDTNNQKLLALIDFMLARTEGRHFYFLYDQVFEDISGPVTQLFQREGDVSVFQCHSDLVELEAVIRGFYHMGHLRNIFILCSSKNTINVFKQITSKALESRSVHWFIILNKNITTKIGKIIREGTQVSAALAVGNRFKLIYSFINRYNEVAFSKAGWWQWHPSRGSTSTKSTFTSSIKQRLYRPLDEAYSDFGGRVMRSAVVDNSPFFKVNDLGNGTVLPHSGIDFHVINTLAAKYNFSYELVLAEDGAWGYLQPDGTFSGMIGKIEKGLAHFAIDEITINTVRESVADFTLPYFLESTTILSPAPHEKNRAFAVFSPFTAKVWLSLCVVTLLIGSIITAATWFRSQYDHGETKLHSLSTFSFTAYRSLVVQGNLLQIRCFYQRTLFVTWFFFCLLIYALYAGTLTAVLTVPTYEKPIDSLWDLLTAIEENGYIPIVAEGSSNEIIFKEATEGIYKQIWELFTFPESYETSREAGIAKVLTGKFVYMKGELGSIIGAKRRGLHKYYFARNTFYPQGYGIACTSGAPYKGVFETQLHRIGWWSWDAERGPSKSLKAPFFRPLEDVYSDLASRHLTATIYPNWPRWIMEELDDGTTRPISGVDYHVLTDVSQKLNFTFWVKVMPTSFGMGGVRPNGNVVGLIGEVHRHAVHLVINEVTLTANREIAVDFTYPYFSEAVTLISPAPRKKLKEYAVFTPFTYEVWILLIIVTMLMGPIVKLIMWIRKIYLKESCEMWESLSDTSFNVFKSVVMQHADNPPGGAIYMVMFGSWYIFCLLMTSLYADVMISALVAPSYEKPIDSLYDLLDAIEHRDYKILLYCGTQSEYMFTNTDKKIYKDIGNTFDYSLKCIKNQDEGMDKIVTGKFVGVNNHMSAEVRANLRGRERYHIARNQFYAHGYGIACPTGSPYKEAFNKVLLPLMWSGIIQKYTNDELRKARTSTHFEEEGPEAFSLLHLQGGFFLFLVGNIGATVAFLAELGAGYYLKNVPDLS